MSRPTARRVAYPRLSCLVRERRASASHNSQIIITSCQIEVYGLDFRFRLVAPRRRPTASRRTLCRQESFPHVRRREDGGHGPHLQPGVSQRAASALLLRARRAASTCASFRALLIVLLVLVIRPTDSALAEPIEFPIVYTTTTSPPRVKRTTLIYDPAPSGGGPATAAVGSISTVATLPMGYGGGTPGAADGVALLGDGTVFALSRNSNLHRVDRLTGAVTFSILSLAASSPPPPISGSLRIDPSNTALWAPGVDGRIARVPIKPTLSPGTSHALQGVDTVIHGLGFAGGRAFYSSPAGVGGGSGVATLLFDHALPCSVWPRRGWHRTAATNQPSGGHRSGPPAAVIGQQQILGRGRWASPITMSIVGSVSPDSWARTLGGRGRRGPTRCVHLRRSDPAHRLCIGTDCLTRRLVRLVN